MESDLFFPITLPVQQFYSSYLFHFALNFSSQPCNPNLCLYTIKVEAFMLCSLNKVKPPVICPQVDSTCSKPVNRIYCHYQVNSIHVEPSPECSRKIAQPPQWLQHHNHAPQWKVFLWLRSNGFSSSVLYHVTKITFNFSLLFIQTYSFFDYQNFMLLKICIGVQLVYNDMLISGVQQSESVIHTHISLLFQIVFPQKLIQKIEYSSLCYTVVDYDFLMMEIFFLWFLIPFLLFSFAYVG